MYKRWYLVMKAGRKEKLSRQMNTFSLSFFAPGSDTSSRDGGAGGGGDGGKEGARGWGRPHDCHR